MGGRHLLKWASKVNNSLSTTTKRKHPWGGPTHASSVMICRFSSKRSTKMIRQLPPRFTSMEGLPKISPLSLAETVMKQKYGDFDALLRNNLFPRPLPPHEAGSSAVPYGENDCQRRYLWTDAFGLLNLVTLAMRAQDERRREQFILAGRALIESVHNTLGHPRSADYPMAPNDTNEWDYGGEHEPFKGLRSGKVDAAAVSDPGMKYDGMFFHFYTKWLFALVRFGQVSGDKKYFYKARNLIKQIHPHFLQRDQKSQPLGVHWKVNNDMTMIPGLERAFPNDDALSGWIGYALVHQALKNDDIKAEVEEIRTIAKAYVELGAHIPSDPLGWGHWWWKSQFLGSFADMHRALLVPVASHALEVRAGMQQPYRLYYALIGAKLSKNPNLLKYARIVLDRVTEIELHTPRGTAHSAINKVMFASALDPLALARRPEERLLNLTIRHP